MCTLKREYFFLHKYWLFENLENSFKYSLFFFTLKIGKNPEAPCNYNILIKQQNKTYYYKIKFKYIFYWLTQSNHNWKYINMFVIKLRTVPFRDKRLGNHLSHLLFIILSKFWNLKLLINMCLLAFPGISSAKR